MGLSVGSVPIGALVGPVVGALVGLLVIFRVVGILVGVLVIGLLTGAWVGLLVVGGGVGPVQVHPDCFSQFSRSLLKLGQSVALP